MLVFRKNSSNRFYSKQKNAQLDDQIMNIINRRQWTFRKFYSRSIEASGVNNITLEDRARIYLYRLSTIFGSFQMYVHVSMCIRPRMTVY